MRFIKVLGIREELPCSIVAVEDIMAIYKQKEEDEFTTIRMKGRFSLRTLSPIDGIFLLVSSHYIKGGNDEDILGWTD